MVLLNRYILKGQTMVVLFWTFLIMPAILLALSEVSSWLRLVVPLLMFCGLFSSKKMSSWSEFRVTRIYIACILWVFAWWHSLIVFIKMEYMAGVEKWYVEIIFNVFYDSVFLILIIILSYAIGNWVTAKKQLIKGQTMNIILWSLPIPLIFVSGHNHFLVILAYSLNLILPIVMMAIQYVLLTNDKKHRNFRIIFGSILWGVAWYLYWNYVHQYFMCFPIPMEKFFIFDKFYTETLLFASYNILSLTLVLVISYCVVCQLIRTKE